MYIYMCVCVYIYIYIYTYICIYRVHPSRDTGVLIPALRSQFRRRPWQPPLYYY